MATTGVEPRPEDLLGEVLVARQPILDRELMVVGQELLYRDVGVAGLLDEEPGIRATATLLIEGVLGLGRGLLEEGEAAHVNVPQALLLDGSLLDLPSRHVNLELHADAADTPELRRAIAEHRMAGYGVVLDGVVADDPRATLSDVVDAVKVDVQSCGRPAALALIRELRARNLRVIADKVEEPAAFDQVVGAGASLVQGFFFTRPRAVRGMRPLGLSPTHFELLRECTKDEVDLDELDRLIRSDLTLADRFLAVIRSPLRRWGEVTSVREGLIALGHQAVHRWVRLLIMSSVVRDLHPEMLMLASIRGRYCEALEERRGTGRGLDAFAAGMFSVLGPDATVSEETLVDLPVWGQVRAALRGEPGVLRTLLDIQVAAEHADWPRLVQLGARLGLNSTQLAEAHVEALVWGNDIVDRSGQGAAAVRIDSPEA